MATSAIAIGLLGLAGMLFPKAILGGVLLNWMARETLIDGIYSRPVAVGNFAHFLGATIVLAKGLTSTSNVELTAADTLFFGSLAAGFGYVAFVGGGRCA